MNIVPPFPDHRFRDPRRMAELAVYREIEAQRRSRHRHLRGQGQSPPAPRSTTRSGPKESRATPRS